MPSTKSTPTRGQSCSTPSGTKPTYCPPLRSRQTRCAPNTHPESDVEMLPAQADDTNHPKHHETHHQLATREHCDDVPMECEATAIDPEDDNTHDSARDSQHNNDNTDGRSTPIIDSNLAIANSSQDKSLQPGQHTRDGHASNPNTSNAVHLHHNAETLTDHQDVANVGYPRLSNTHHIASPGNPAPVAAVEPLQPDNTTKEINVPQRPTHTPTIPHDANPADFAENTANDSTAKHLTLKDHFDSRSQQSGPPAQKCRQSSRQTSRISNGPKTGVGQSPETVLDLLTHNTAYQQMDNNANELTASDDVVFVKATLNPIDNILCSSKQSRNFLISSKEIIAGWPNSFAHADSEYFAKLATCYLIQFPSYMCYAVTALRVLTHAPWSDNMFHGHIRELVLCAIGNGWTWTDQTATVQGRRVSIGEVCAAFASYLNLTAFPPGQVSDLDTAIIAVCDDLFPDHCERLFAQLRVNCFSCSASGQVSTSLFDTMLIVNLENDTIDLAQMIAGRTPRLALDRDDIGFSHASDCHNEDQLNYEEIEGCLIFTLKITSPIEQLPPATKALHFLGQSFNVPTASTNPVSQAFIVTGVIIVQGKSSHHFLIIERCNKGQVLLYDNLRGHTWIPIEQLKATSLVWGFIFRRHDHQPYAFQPPQYKAIAPDTHQFNKRPHRPKQPKSKPKNTLGISARRYNFSNLPKKTLRNDVVPTDPPEALQCKQADPHTEVPPSCESLHQNDIPAHTSPAHNGASNQHGVPVVGCPPDNTHISPPLQNELASDDNSNQHGVPMVGSAQPAAQSAIPTQPKDRNDDIAEGQRGVPTVGLPALDQQGNSPHSHLDFVSKESKTFLHAHENADLEPASAVTSAQCTAQEHMRAESARLHSNNDCDEIGPSGSHPDCLRPPVNGENDTSHCPFAKEKDASPPKRAKYSKAHPYAIISLFDGVGSAIPAITKAIGCAPRIIIVAECDPILRQLVSEQFSFRTDGKWTQSSKDTFTLYTDDVRQLLRDQCRIFKEAFALAGPQCRWFVIAGSPCQDLTPAGPLKGLLGLTGPCSSLFYYVHVILWLLQMNYPLELIRFLLENAGTMLEIHRKAILRALGLNVDLHPDHFRVDPKNTHGIKRNRFYFRNYQDCAKVPKTVVLAANDLEGPLLDFSGFPIPFGPLLRVRAVLGHNVYQLSWTAYQPISLIWDYLFWGDKTQFQTKAKMQCSDTIPALDFEKSLPPHYLRAWNRFIQSLRQTNVSTIDRDRLVRAILPIFHHPYIKAPMRILSCEEVEKLAGLHNHFDRVHAHRSLLTELELTVRNYCGNSFHPEHIQAAIGHPERLRNWLIEPAEPPTQPPWSGVIHPKQARAQYHALREQVQTLARTQRIRDLSSKQVGLDPMPDFPIHALEGNLAPVMPTVLPVQLLPAARKIHPDDLGIRENKPPSQLSLMTIQLLQQKQMQNILTGMKFFGAGIGRAEDILCFFLGDHFDTVIERHCPQAKEWLSHQLKSAGHCTYTMARTLLWLYSLLHREQVSVHFVHIADWEDHAHIATFGDSPAQWTVYCVQFPRSRTFHLDTAAWNCHLRVDIPWQPTPHLVVYTATPIPFHCTNPNCIWFAIPYGPNGQYLISHRLIGTFLYNQCIVCFLSWVVEQASCNAHTTASSYPELSGCMFIDNEGNVAIAAAHNWRFEDTTGYQTCLVKASIDSRLFHYPEHCDSLPHINPIGNVSPELAHSWCTNDAVPDVAFFLCSLLECNQ